MYNFLTKSTLLTFNLNFLHMQELFSTDIVCGVCDKYQVRSRQDFVLSVDETLQYEVQPS